MPSGGSSVVFRTSRWPSFFACFHTLQTAESATVIGTTNGGWTSAEYCCCRHISCLRKQILERASIAQNQTLSIAGVELCISVSRGSYSGYTEDIVYRRGYDSGMEGKYRSGDFRMVVKVDIRAHRPQLCHDTEWSGSEVSGSSKR